MLYGLIHRNWVSLGLTVFNDISTYLGVAAAYNNINYLTNNYLHRENIQRRNVSVKVILEITMLTNVQNSKE